MRKIIAVALCLFASPAIAIDMRGQWNVEMPDQSSGTILIDAAQRATWDLINHDARTVVAFRGYVAVNRGSEVEIPFTNQHFVLRLHCTVQSRDLLHCFGYFVAESRGRPGLVMR